MSMNILYVYVTVVFFCVGITENMIGVRISIIFVTLTVFSLSVILTEFTGVHQSDSRISQRLQSSFV